MLYIYTEEIGIVMEDFGTSPEISALSLITPQLEKVIYKKNKNVFFLNFFFKF